MISSSCIVKKDSTYTVGQAFTTATYLLTKYKLSLRRINSPPPLMSEEGRESATYCYYSLKVTK